MNVKVNWVSLKWFKIQMDTGSPAGDALEMKKQEVKRMTVKSKIK